MNVNGQTQTGTSITYIHNKPASFKSRLLQLLMSSVGMKHRTERNIKAEKFSSEAAPMPKTLRDNYSLKITEVKGRKIWTFKPNQSTSEKVLLYIHGGAYIANLTKYDWQLIEDLLIKTGATIVVPDYPLAPASTCEDVYDFFEPLYVELLAKVSQQQIIFMGNSAGGGFALGFAQKLRNENRPQPSQIILVSPWLDITMGNPGIAEVDKKDKALGIRGLQMAGQLYTGELDGRDFRVSPIYGNFSDLGKISLFIGTHDLFIADARKLKSQLDEANIPANYFEYPKMFHVWIAITSLKESQHAIEQIAKLINSSI